MVDNKATMSAKEVIVFRNSLERLLASFIARFPRTLTRTEIVKLIYLFEYHYVQLYGRSYCSVQFVRHYYGPHCADIVPALDDLSRDGLIRVMEEPNGVGGITYFHEWVGTSLPSLDFETEYLISSMIGQTENLDLSGIKGLAYSTPPMRKLLQREAELGCKLYGEVIDMMAGKKRKIPVSRLKAAFKKIDCTPRGTDEEYHETVTREFEGLRVFRERANKCQV